MKFGVIRKRLLTYCLMASIAVHIGAIWFLSIAPMSMEIAEAEQLMKPALDPTIVPKESEQLIVEKMEKALEESLNAVSLAPQNDLAEEEPFYEEEEEEYVHTKTLFISKPKIRDSELVIQKASNEFTTSMPPPFDPEFEASLQDFALSDDLNEDPLTFEPEKFASVDFGDPHLVEETAPIARAIEDDYTISDQQFSPSAVPTHTGSGLDPHFVASLQMLKTSKTEKSEDPLFSKLEESTTPKLILPNSVDYLRSQWIKRSLAERSLPSLEHYGLESVETKLDWEEEVDMDIALMPAPDGERYIFSITVHPEFDTDCQTMRQNFYFLIDRSSSVEKQKFNRYKRAVQRALTALHEGDNFNISIFDKKVSALSNRTLPVTPRTIQKAEDFLDGESAKTHFAATEFYNSIEELLPTTFDPNEMHSVILITDGNTLLNSQKQKRALTEWAEKCDHNVNVYTAASGKGNNLVLLDLLSYCTGGRMLYSDTNAGFPRKLVRLVKDLHHPIVKNVSFEITPDDGNTKVGIHPRSNLLPPMFVSQPYTITGTLDELCDLTLYVQGKNHDKWLNIRKRISLKEADRGGRALERQWAHTKAHICYDHFLKNGKNTHLKEAIQIVAPFRGSIASEQ